MNLYPLWWTSEFRSFLSIDIPNATKKRSAIYAGIRNRSKVQRAVRQNGQVLQLLSESIWLPKSFLVKFIFCSWAQTEKIWLMDMHRSPGAGKHPTYTHTKNENIVISLVIKVTQWHPWAQNVGQLKSNRKTLWVQIHSSWWNSDIQQKKKCEKRKRSPIQNCKSTASS